MIREVNSGCRGTATDWHVGVVVDFDNLVGEAAETHIGFGDAGLPVKTGVQWEEGVLGVVLLAVSKNGHNSFDRVFRRVFRSCAADLPDSGFQGWRAVLIGWGDSAGWRNGLLGELRLKPVEGAPGGPITADFDWTDR